ncbi:LptE family protein [Riemerella columbipharyngis]|uniref:Lipopolysaccharide-assembly n=1 Tax=Riemerella columbipharyngis TaxID=1071918 RepID=A0A1G7DZD6_9FLAO|nr:LptE family protein [Riemerella columbipharyngis]SDE56742.1 Lipopolysaccharide-assembly [Riemerella columbipharyngis]
MNILSKYKKSFLRSILALMVLTILCGCYSFIGNSLTPEMKTIQIKNFPNNAPLVTNPMLSQQFTIDLQNRFLQRTTLKGTNTKPDLLLEGEITDYNISPTSITTGVQAQNGVVQAAQNKLSISVKVHYENAIDPKLNFDKTYTDEVVFSSNLDINQIESSQVNIVTDRIINKIFNDIVANW